MTKHITDEMLSTLYDMTYQDECVETREAMRDLMAYYNATKDSGRVSDCTRIAVLAIKHCDRDRADFDEIIEILQRLDLPALEELPPQPEERKR